MSVRLDGKVAVITGAASGIGRGIARRFHEEGAALVLGDIEGDGLELLAREIGGDVAVLAAASLNAVQPAEGMAAYCAAKVGGAMLTKVAAMELGRRRVRVNAIAPGLVETGATSAFWMLPGVVDEFVENTTVGRFAQPEDVANLAVFLASDESTFVSGGLVPVDGGAATKRYPDLPAAMARLAALDTTLPDPPAAP